MALQQQKSKDATQGPTMQTDGLPVNPSDEIFKGKALPIVQAQTTTQHRPFSMPTKPPLFACEGDGMDDNPHRSPNCKHDE